MSVVGWHGSRDSGNVADVKAAVAIELVAVRPDGQLARFGH